VYIYCIYVNNCGLLLFYCIYLEKKNTTIKEIPIFIRPYFQLSMQLWGYDSNIDGYVIQAILSIVYATVGLRQKYRWICDCTISVSIISMAFNTEATFICYIFLP
jgi:hypothetical protein